LYSTILSELKNRDLGYPVIRNLDFEIGFSLASIFAIVMFRFREKRDREAFSSSGEVLRQCPHQGAKNWIKSYG
jgi:hypothetical protein